MLRGGSNYRDKMKRMKNHVSCLQSRANQLQREQELVQQQLAVFEGLLCARSTWRQVVEGLLDSSWEADELIVEQEDRELQALLDEQPQNPEHVLEQLPLLGALRRIDRQMYETILALTPASAGKQWVSFTSDTMQLLLLHDLDPTLAAPLLTAHMVHVTAWLLCLYYFNTQVALALHNVNLLTRQKETPPPGHYATALQAAGISTQQLRQIAIANRFVAPRLHKLQQEQEHLVQQMAELQQRLGPGEAALVGGLVAAAGGGAQLPDSAADGPHAAACGGDVRQLASPPTLGALGVGVMPSTAAEVKADPDDAAVAATVVSSVATDAATTAGSSHVGGGGSGSSTTGGDSSNRLRQQQLAKANELMQKMSANHRAWVVVASMRGHYSTSVLHPIQFAKLVTASAPYLLFGAPIYDNISAGSDTSTADNSSEPALPS